MTVQIKTQGNVVILTIDNPPVNVIGVAVRKGLMAGLDEALAIGAERIIITGAGKTFVAGADTKEFDVPPAAPHLTDVLERIDTFPVPCIAAVNGTALGGGLEIALACQYRIGAPVAQIGLPEVTLGVIPGAGGTQRLPRLIGFAPALEMIALGQPISASKALEMGVFDALAENPVAAALSLDAALLSAAVPVGTRTAPAVDPEAVEKTRAKAARALPGQTAPLRAISLVELAATTPLSEGLKAERETFLELRASDQAKALRHFFFAERRAMSRGKSVVGPVVDINSAVVVGGGNMGASITYALANAGICVTLVEADTASADRARSNVQRLYDQGVNRGRIAAQAAEVAMETRHAFVVGYDKLPKAQIAIEAAFEDMDVKKAILASLEAALPESAILASNTSYLDVNCLAQTVADRTRVLGLHFFSPAHIMKLLEVVRGSDTSDVAVASVFRLAQRLRKIPVPSGVCDGFIGNRILTRYRQTTDILMLEGALPWQIDDAMRAFGFAMGPYEVQDLSGLDIAYANRKRLGLRDKAGYRYISIADRLVNEQARLGRKTGGGWYDYPEGGSSRPSALVEEVILDTARREGIARRSFDAEDIQTRALSAMIDEASHILDEGIAEKPEDIDLVMIHGYAFPRWRGGLMHYADTIGVTTIVDRLTAYAAQDPLSWSIPDLLRRLDADGRNFTSLNQAKT